MLPPWSLARARLARAVQDGRPAGEIDELRRAYRAARAKQALCDLLAGDYPPNDSQRRELVFVLVAGGDVDGAA
jgi:hypothetical protein